MNGDWIERLVPKHPLWFVWAGGSIMSFWLVFWWAIGAFPTTAFGAGFARAEDVKSVTQLVLESQLLSTRIRQCSAPTSEIKQFYASEVARLTALYREKLNVDYYLPDCNEVVVAADATP